MLKQSVTFTRSAKLLLAGFLITSLVLSVSAAATLAGMDTPLFQKGVCFVTWERDRFASEYSDQALERLKNLGVEFIQLNITQYQDRYNSTDIKATNLTPSDESVKHVIGKAHKLGMKVMLKPHIDLLDDEDGTYWRADIGFTTDEDWNKWFDEYEGVITHYAKMAERKKVEIFCVGTELSFASQKTDKWKDLIAKVRKTFSGKLTYAANWDEYKNVKFWDDLDFAGIDAYFPLTYKNNPSIEDIREGWKKWAGEIEDWHAGINKPVVFTEIGYSSAENAPSEPWKNGAGKVSVETQAKCYKAFFDTVWNSKWLSGVYWWKWAPSAYGGGKNNREFTPMNKPAEKILEEKYKARITYFSDLERKEVEQKAKTLEQKVKDRAVGSSPMAEERKLDRTKK